MEINVPRSNVSVKGLDVQKFGMEDSAEAFSLIADLYSRPIEAIMRELSTNASDSHKEAKTKKPFDVFLPTSSNSIVYWRDYGTGLSKENVEKVYTRVFASDKRNSNTTVGCFGLGSKSPFNYTDTMTVDSYIDNTHYHYLIFLNDEGIPSYTLVSEEATTEPNGVKVEFKVKSQDQYKFLDAARTVFKYFDQVPNFIGADVKIEKPKYILQKNFWGIKTHQNSYNREESKLIMGQVAYGFDRGNLDKSLTPQEKKFVNNCSFDFNFDIGELSLPPNRESVKINDSTILKIRDKINKCINDLKEELEKKLAKCDSLWDARITYLGTNSYIKNIVEAKWKNVALFPNDRWGYSSETINLSTIKLSKDDFSDVTRGTRRETYTLWPTNNVIFVKNDLNIGALSRCKEAANNTDDNYYLIKDDAVILKKVKEHIGISDKHIILASSLPKATSKGIKRGKTYKISLFDPKSYGSSYSWTDTIHEVKKGGYYIEIFRYDGKKGDNTYKYTDIRKIINFLRTKKIEVDNLYGIRSAFLEKALKEGGKKWINILDLAEEELEKSSKKKFKFSSGNNLWKVNEGVIKSLGSTKIGDLLVEAKKLIDSPDKEAYNNLEKMNKILYTDIKFDKTDICKDIDSELEKYPLVDFRDRSNLSHAKQYIQLVESGVIK